MTAQLERLGPTDLTLHLGKPNLIFLQMGRWLEIMITQPIIVGDWAELGYNDTFGWMFNKNVN